MDTNTGENGGNQEGQPLDELALLKNRARLMGVEFSNNIKLETLKARVDAKMNGQPDPTQEQLTGDQQGQANGQPNALEIGAASVTAPATSAPAAADKTPYQRAYEKHMRLIRVRITNMDPKKKDLPGEIFTVANELLGTVRKFVPYGEATEEGYHLPYCLYKMLDRKKFQHISTTKDKRTGTPKVNVRWAKEFALEILDPLTPQELERLAQAQLAAGSVDSESL